jgi:hypothetical protein
MVWPDHSFLRVGLRDKVLEPIQKNVDDIVPNGTILSKEWISSLEDSKGDR